MRPTPLKILLRMINKVVESNELVYGAAVDSRLVKAGELFFAIRGEKVDGHAYLEQVAAKHAVAAVVEESYRGPDFGLKLIPVQDVKGSLQELARNYLAKLDVKVVAITGSLGKTMTKEFAKTLIGSTYRLFASPLSYNSQLTVPLCILSARGDEEIFLLEMGMSQPGNLARLVEIAPPDIALITTVAIQHADAFDNGLEGIALEKGSIFFHPKTEIGLYNATMPYAEAISKIGTCRKQVFSTSCSDVDFFAKREGNALHIHEKGEASYSVDVQLPMRVYDQNFLAAFSLARVLGIPWPILREAAQFVKVPPMRFERVEQAGITFINDAYNANPDAMLAAFESLPKPKPGGRVIGVISEMNALGQYAEEGHAQVGKAALSAVDCLFCVGQHCSIIEELWNQQGKECTLFANVEELNTHLKSIVKPGDVVLLKGARAYALDRLLNQEWHK